ncbi:MAG TPA: hypothetical protein VNM43_05600 [Dehalococcoidia bacterium]|nr:hypothetical protein [Dehalococcoidia bacterium]
MELPEQLTRLARLGGRDEFVAALGPPEELWTLTLRQRAAIFRYVRTRVQRIAEELVKEAAASDDVLSAADAEAFIAERIAELGGALARVQADAIARAARERLASWRE